MANAQGKVPVPLSLERSPSGSLLAGSRGCSPFTSPRRTLSSPSILRRKISTPLSRQNSKLLSFAKSESLPSLPAVSQPDAKAVASVVMSPHRVADPQKLQAQVKMRAHQSPSKSARPTASKRSVPASSRRSKGTWSGRIYVKFNESEGCTEAEGFSQPDSPVVQPRPTSHTKRKRQHDSQESSKKHSRVKQDPARPLLSKALDDGAQKTFSSTVSHVLLAMAELQDQPTSPTSPQEMQEDSREIPNVEDVCSLLLEASSGMKAKAGDTSPLLASNGQGSNTTNGQLSSTQDAQDAAQSDVSIQSVGTDRDNGDNIDLLADLLAPRPSADEISILEEARNQNSSSLENAQQAPLID